MHVVDMVFFWARAEPHRPAIIQPEMVTTFQGLADAIESICERIDRLGLDKREPIAVSLANPSFFAAAAFAVLRCGHSVALANLPLLSQLQPAGIRNLIYDTQGLMLSGGRNIRFDMSWLPGAVPPTARKPYRRRALGDVDIIAFTSGTTGLPKPHVQPRAALEQRLGSATTNWAGGSDSRALVMPGISSRFGFNRVCDLLSAGKAACFAPTPEDALWLISTFYVDAVVASPQQAAALAEAQATAGRYPLVSLKFLRIAGAKILPGMMQKLRSQLCRNVIVAYSSTEAGVVASASCDAIENIPDAVGFVGPDVELQICDEAGAELPAGQDGYIRLRTPHWVLSQQMNEATASAGAGGAWFHPGDIGHVTADGVLCVTGRSSDVINSGGVKVSAGKIAEIAQTLPGIKEAAACGILGPAGLEEVWIAVVAQAPVDVAEIKRRLKQHKEIGIEPAEVFVLDQLPRGEVGKVQQHRLREQLLLLKKGA